MTPLASLDWTIIFAFFAISLVIGLLVSKRAGKSYTEFFLSGRQMPWWLLGVSMVATTFAADTPTLVTDIVRKNGVSGNWEWWAFLLTGMLTVFVYARLWRRSGIVTDLEFYELRYSGTPARILRAFRALYLGVFFNVMIMGTVLLAGIKMGSLLLGLEAWQTILITGGITVLYSALGGLRGVLLTDFVQFALAMIGSIAAAWYLLQLPEVGGLSALMSQPAVQDKLSILPDFSDMNALVPLLIVPLAVQWWSVWYPGAEPGGGGYIVQRMLSAKNENHAFGATLFFNVAHYALRPWPWILIALCSIVLFPDLDSLRLAFPHVAEGMIEDDLGYPAMLSYLPAGLLGLVIASLIAALLSTLSTHLNWGSSYVVHDFYKRFLKPEAGDKELVLVGRLSTVLLMVLAALVAVLLLKNALQAFKILLQIGAGTGLIFILRWFWWRINAYSEIVGMVVSFLVAIYFERIYEGDLPSHWRLIYGVGITTVAWVTATLLTRPTEQGVLWSFYQLVRPDPRGWKPVLAKAQAEAKQPLEPLPAGRLPLEIAGMVIGCFVVYSLLFGTGFLLYGQWLNAAFATAVALLGSVALWHVWRRIR
jgi:SSS family solute:Na+ symporter